MLVLTILLQQAKEHMQMVDQEEEQYLILLEELVLVRLIKDMMDTQEVVQVQVYGLGVVEEQELQEIIPVLEEQV